MTKAQPLDAPCVLALGGLDPSGGAGILADARAIARAGAFPCAVATVLTVQSTRGLARVVPVRPALWSEQARRVLSDQRVLAMKTGALGGAASVRAACALATPRIPLVVDPVMLPTRGRARLLSPRALVAMRALVARATIVTANVAEAETLTGIRIADLAGARRAAHALTAMGAHAALVKGGHLTGERAVDVLVIGGTEHDLSLPRLRLRRHVHGTGCYLASLIAARLARGDDVVRAANFAKRAHHAALARAVRVGGPLDVLV